MLLQTPFLFAQNMGGEDCVDAVDLGVPGGPETCPGGAGFMGENTDSAAVAKENPSCDQIGNNFDLWYKFTAPASGDVQLNINLGTAGRIEAAVYENCGGDEVLCSESHSNGLMINDLMPGEEYFLQLWSDAIVTGTFDFCLFEKQGPPINDTCGGAVALPLQISNDPCNVTGAIMYNNYGSTASGALPRPGCSNFGQGRDVWFSVVGPASGELTLEMISAGPPDDWAMSLYSGTCGSLTELYCNDDGGAGLLPLIKANALTPGETYLLRVFEFGGDDFGSFELLATEVTMVPPVNDACANAIDITSNLVVQGSCLPFCGHNINSTASGETPTPAGVCGAFGAGKDVWYKATVPATGAISIELQQYASAGPQDWAMAAYTGSCGALVEIDCDDDSGPSLYPRLDVINRTPGEVIYFRIWEFNGDDEGSFDICARGYDPLALALLTFSGQATNEGNLLKWRLAELDGIHTFNILSISNEGDDWEVVAELSAIDHQLRYEFTHSTNTSNYYMLRSYDSEGDMDESNVIFINAEEEDDLSVSIFPNPATDVINVSWTGTDNREELILELIDASGKVVEKVLLPSGLRKDIDVQNRNSGIYFIRLSGKSINWTGKVLVE